MAGVETVTFEIGDLAAGAAYVIQLVLRAVTDGDFDLEVSATSQETDKTTTNNSSEVTTTVQAAEDVIITTILHRYGLCGAVGFMPFSLLLIGLAAMRGTWRARLVR